MTSFSIIFIHELHYVDNMVSLSLLHTGYKERHCPILKFHQMFIDSGITGLAALPPLVKGWYPTRVGVPFGDSTRSNTLIKPLYATLLETCIIYT